MPNHNKAEIRAQQQAIFDNVCDAFSAAALPILKAKHLAFAAAGTGVREVQNFIKKSPFAASNPHSNISVTRDALKAAAKEIAQEDADGSAQLLAHFILTSQTLPDPYDRKAKDAELFPVPEQTIRPGAFVECAAEWKEICAYMKDRYELEPREVDTVLCNAFRALSADGKNIKLDTNLVAKHETIATALARPYPAQA